MNRNLLLSLLLLLFAGSSLALTRTQDENESLEERVQALEAQVASMRRASDGAGLSKKVADMSDLLDETVSHLYRQSEGAGHLRDALTESEEKGFTFGINPESREVMLAGLRSFIDAVQQELPPMPEDEDEQPVAR